MKKLALVLLFLVPSFVQAGPVHFVKTHKEVLIADALLIAAHGADVGSSIHCQRVGHQYCDETGALFLPAHPNEMQNALYGYGEGAILVSLNHLVWHYAPEKSERHLFWFWTGADLVGETFNVWSNARTAEQIQACYHDGLCK